MSPELPSHFPNLPDPWPRPADFVPRLSPVDADPQTSAAPEPPPPTAEAATPTEEREQQRITLAGRLGQNPTARTTPKGTLVARFPLGVKADEDLNKTTWHQVYAFRDRAAQVRDMLKRGDAVEVIGYRHQREVPGRTGPRTVEEIYATVIKLR